MIVHLVLRDPLWLLWWALIAYGAGVLSWEFNTFFRAEHWSWEDVRRGFIWPVWWARTRMGRR